MPLSIFDSSRVDASEYAYKRMNSPGRSLHADYLRRYCCAGGCRWAASRTTNPWLPIAMGVKTVLDSATALQLAREEWQENKALCAYCQMATLASLASVALAWPEIRSAIDTLRGRSA